MHNESMADRSEPNADPSEPIKRSKLSRIKNAASLAGIYMIPVAGIGGLMFYSHKISKMDLETARLNLETARLQDLADAATQQ